MAGTTPRNGAEAAEAAQEIPRMAHSQAPGAEVVGVDKIRDLLFGNDARPPAGAVTANVLAGRN